jgi:hypothetical protein
MSDPLPPMPTWLRSALLALVVLLAAGVLIFLVRFFVIVLYVALGAAVMALGIWGLVRIYQLFFA